MDRMGGASTLLVRDFSARMPAAAALPRAPAIAPVDDPVFHRPLSPLRPASSRPSPEAARAITINFEAPVIHITAAPGMDEKALAEVFARRMREYEWNAAARIRSSLTDSD